ncbi:MAG: hypothetical protein LBG19_00260 [Prevotellaceae bacterium]|jgi:hypothetical protein|nr:hypothetical protein [Prevotellaceae bacterium]
MKNILFIKHITVFFSLAVALLVGIDARACTSAIITGKATADGRPLMWKHRDTGTEQNRIVYSNAGKYAYIGLVNSDDVTDNEVWAGTNSAGFCVMNTASYNLKDKNDTTTEADFEGIVMRQALECCATLADFERFLDTLSRPMKVEANFAVIDANGGAAYYETNNHSYFKADANDPMQAPHGYLIRSNFSYSGRIDEGMGYIRHETAVHLFSRQRAYSKITPEWIFSSVDRSYYHSLLGTDLKDYDFKTPGATGFAIDQDYIPRFTTSASIVFRGVKQGELPEHTTMWTALGFPSCSVAVALWVKGGEKLPVLMVKGKDTENAPLCEKVAELKHRVFSIKRGNGAKYFNWALLYNSQNTGIMQLLAPVEKEIFVKAYAAMEQWGDGSWSQASIQRFYTEINTFVEGAYKEFFNL